MTFPFTVRGACVAAGIALAAPCHAESFASSASSAGSQSSGSVSDSLHGSSHSSSGNDKKRADADYRILEVGAAPGRAGFARLTLQTDDSPDTLTLDLPEAIAAGQALAPGDRVHARRQVYGYEFARVDTHEAFFLVLDDDWFDGLAARPVTL